MSSRDTHETMPPPAAYASGAEIIDIPPPVTESTPPSQSESVTVLSKELATAQERLKAHIGLAHSEPTRAITVYDGRFCRSDPTRDGSGIGFGLFSFGTLSSLVLSSKSMYPFNYVDPKITLGLTFGNLPHVADVSLTALWRKNLKDVVGLPYLRQQHETIQYSVLPASFNPANKDTGAIYVDTQIAASHLKTRAEKKNFIASVGRVVEGLEEDTNVVIPAIVKPYLELPDHIEPVPAKSFYKQLTGVEVKKIGNRPADDQTYRLVMTVPEFLAASAKVRSEIAENYADSEPDLIKDLLLSIQRDFPKMPTGKAIEAYFNNPETKPELVTKLRNLLNLSLLRNSEPMRERELVITDQDVDIINHRSHATPVYIPANGSTAHITMRNQRFESHGQESPEQFLGRPLAEVTDDAPLTDRILAVLELVSTSDDAEVGDGTHESDKIVLGEGEMETKKASPSLLEFIPHIEYEPYRRNRLRVTLGKIAAAGLIAISVLQGPKIIDLLDIDAGSSGDGPSRTELDKQLRSEKIGVGDSNLPENVPEWKVEGLGGMSAEGYYGRFNSHQYEAGAWQGDKLFKNNLQLPEVQFINPQHQRIHVEGQFSPRDGKLLFALPFKQFTQPVNLRLTTADGRPVSSYTVAASFNGAYYVSVYDAPDWIKVDYDLIENEFSYLKSGDPITGAGDVLIDVPAIRRIPVRQDFNIKELAKSISTQFKYKEADKVYESWEVSPANFVNEVVKARVANCNIATTVIALTMAHMDEIRRGGEFNYSVVGGYINEDTPGPGNTVKYLQAKERHAYITLHDGEIVDGTPSQLAKGEKADKDDTLEDLDKVWKKNVDDRIEAAAAAKHQQTRNNTKALQIGGALTGLAALGGYAAHRRKKHIDRVLSQPGTAHAATDFLTWLQYAENPYNEKYHYRKDGRTFNGSSIDKLASELSNNAKIQDYLDSPKYFENGQLSKDQVYLARYLARQLAYPAHSSSVAANVQLANA